MKVYKIRSGDTLSQIAEHFKVPMEVLIIINGITNPDYIRTGDWLMLSEIIEW